MVIDNITEEFDEFKVLVDKTFSQIDHDFIVEESHYPDTPGVVIRVEKDEKFYILQLISTKSLKDYFLDPLLSQEEKKSYEYLETHFLDYAKMLCQKFHNKKLPISEEILTNLGDLSYCWTMKIKESLFEIHFRKTSAQNLSLGPLGDISLAMNIFEKITQYYKSLDPNLDVTIDKKKIIFDFHKVNQDYKNELKNLQSIFTEGASISHWVKKDCSIPETVKIYLEEISIIRQFWLKIRGQIDSDSVKKNLKISTHH